MADARTKVRPCQEVARAIAEALAAMDSQPSDELVLKRNYIERLKREKNPEAVVEELPQITISTCPFWCTAPEINCVAFVRAEKEGRKGFTVLVGGGLASTP